MTPVSLLTSLLTAIVRADGDALVLHSGERPYVVAPGGNTQIASRPLTLDALHSMITELLPEAARHSLDEYGAVQHEFVHAEFTGGETFAVVAARGGDDIWIEIRRHRSGPAPDAEKPEEGDTPAEDVARPAVVLPISRSQVRADPRVSPLLHPGGIDRLLRIAAARGASTLYLASQARPVDPRRRRDQPDRWRGAADRA